MNDITQADLLEMTGQIVAAHVGHNAVSISDVPTLIISTHAALASLGQPATVEPAKIAPAVPINRSIKPGALISLIDGKAYKMLRRHLSTNGYTPESYRETFGLPAGYPMVAAEYAATRRDLALKIGLGRKRAR